MIVISNHFQQPNSYSHIHRNGDVFKHIPTSHVEQAKTVNTVDITQLASSSWVEIMLKVSTHNAQNAVSAKALGRIVPRLQNKEI